MNPSCLTATYLIDQFSILYVLFLTNESDDMILHYHITYHINIMINTDNYKTIYNGSISRAIIKVPTLFQTSSYGKKATNS